MSKIKTRIEETEVFTCTDGREFRDKVDARDHQKFIDRKGLSEKLEEFIHKTYGIPTQEEIDNAFDKEDNWDNAEKLEEKRNEFFYNNCVGMFRNQDVDEVAEYFIDAWQSFGEDKIGQFFLFVKERLDQ